MGNSSTKAKAKWNKDHYDTHLLYIPKGNKSVLQQNAKDAGMSFNAYILHALKKLNKK